MNAQHTHTPPTHSSNRPDPCYKSPGYIDVLVPPSAEISSVVVGDGCGDDSTSSSSLRQRWDVNNEALRHTSATTPSYDIELYDMERWISVSAGTSSSLDTHQQKKVKYNHNTDCNISSASYHRHKACWEAFQYYLDRSIPVKIQNVASFRDVSASDTSQIGKGDCLRVLPINVASLPSAVLDTTVTVQCAFASALSNDESNLTAQEIDKAISFSGKGSAFLRDGKPSADNNTRHNDTTNDQNAFTFMGQEDQITTEMTLREAVTWNDRRTNNDAEQSSPSMAVCVAQVPILSVDSSDEEHPGVAIKLHADGRVEMKGPSDTVSTNDSLNQTTPLSSLASMLRLPSHLLLGNPDHTPGSIAIHDINLWHAPQNCLTNVHYDERDNLLLVTEGVKTVELCPPGCIRASETLYSEHANHPALLRWRGDGQGYNSKTTKEEIQQTLMLKRQRTHIVSISAGEGLFIPSGWWHRVESDICCTAVNVWFHYHHRVQQNDPKHMVSFKQRQSARKYYEEHGELTSKILLESKRKKKLSSLIDDITAIDVSGSSSSKLYDREDWRKMVNLITNASSWNAETVHLFIALFAGCCGYCTSTSSQSVEVNCVGLISRMLDAFLILIDLSDEYQLRALVEMWISYPVEEDRLKEKFFMTLVQGLSPESCFIITEAWEKCAKASASENADRRQQSVQESYKQFFRLVGDANEKRLRHFLLRSVEMFRDEVSNSFQLHVP
eukprot:scaffold5351_cov199-Alexandrium_tamarense.AAC.7